MLDSSAAKTIGGFVQKAGRHGAAVYISGAPAAVQAILRKHGAAQPHVQFSPTLSEAVGRAHAEIRAGHRKLTELEMGTI